MPNCAPCESWFNTWNQLQKHWVQSPKHYYCRYCDDLFIGENELEEHYVDFHIYCLDCRRIFKNEFGRREHYRQSDQHHYCAPCDRHFISKSNLHNHLDSSVHRPKDVPCPCCNAMFVSLPALALHFDSGFCISGINRNMVNRLVREYDMGNEIIDSAKSTQSVGHVAARSKPNGQRGYECHLCHKPHVNLKALKHHLASPRHQPQIYVCPEYDCGNRFSVFSALMQHVESEKCCSSMSGIVQRTMEYVVEEMPHINSPTY